MYELLAMHAVRVTAFDAAERNTLQLAYKAGQCYLL